MDEGVFSKAYVQGEEDLSVFKEGYTSVGLGSFLEHERYWKAVLTSQGKDIKKCTRKDKKYWRKAT